VKPYEFSVLRYIFDSLTQEFINVGVVLYSAEMGFLDARLNMNYGRATKVFGRIDSVRYRLLLRHLQEGLDRIADELAGGLIFGAPKSLEVLLSRVLPFDDSSLRFARGGAGVTDDLSKACEKLYHRYVMQAEPSGVECRTREEVWRTFRAPMEKLQITRRLVAKRITGSNYGYEFQHAWKNGVWNLYEPISFDLTDESAIREKANKWLGRSLSLHESAEPFKLALLVGAPQNSRLRDAFQQAENILNKMPGKKQIVKEHEAESFALELASQLNASDSQQVA